MLLQVLHLWCVVVDDVGLIGVLRHVALMVILGGIEGLERLDRRGGGPGIQGLAGQLGHVGLGGLLLIRITVENRRAILSANVRSLAVKQGRLVYGAEQLAQLLGWEPRRTR